MDNLFCLLEPWELHPITVHFPIAFLLGGAVLLLWSLRWPSERLQQTMAGLLMAGILFGWLAAAAGGLAYYTVPAHTAVGHELMKWHLGLGLTTLVLFTWLSIMRWRRETTSVSTQQLIATLLGILLLLITGHLGGSIVFRHGAGIDPAILSPEIRTGHLHVNDQPDASEPSDEHHHNRPDPHQHH